MHATVTVSPNRDGKRRLLTSCAIGAGMVALAYGGPALAQVNGNAVPVNVGAGTSINSNAGTNTTTVSVTQAQSIINWVPTDTAPTGGAIDFLPVGETWSFSGSGDYTVFNRFVNGTGGTLSRQIALNGTVNSTDVLTSGGRGGNIWFYNAGGILIGATGVINVGSLVLTTNDIITTGGLFGPGGTIRFNGASGSTSAITVNGAINANNAFNPGNAYVALVAPRVVQAGAVRVDGSAAYVAAEQAEIRINGGLFDINVTMGAEGGNAISHTGTTTGPAHQQGDTNNSRIYMVAIPKNDAVTMLVSGQVGYDDALSAQIDPDGAVRLSAGYNVTGGEIDGAPANATAANLSVNDTLFRSDTIARASGNFVGESLQATSPSVPNQGRVFVEGNGLFIGDASATINVGVNQVAGATGDFILQSGGLAAASGDAAINIDGGQLTVAGALGVIADRIGDPVTGIAVGGDAALRVENGGDVNVTGNINVTADAVGGFSAAGVGGNGTGGNATIDLLGGTITAADIVASAAGIGGIGAFGSDQDPANIIPGSVGGIGRGGAATISVDGAAVVNANEIRASALGTGGAGGDFFNFASFGAVPGTPGDGGEGIGGAASVNVRGGTTTSVDMIANASGIGGDGGNSFFSSSSGGATGIGVGGTGGAGRGGNATIALSSAVAVTNLMNGVAQGIGGNGGDHNVGGNGGDGFGGLSQAIVTGFDVGALTVRLDASAQGGAGANADDGNGGTGGNAVGGTARAQADGAGGGLTVVGGNFITDGVGGTGGSGRVGFGSSATTAPTSGNGGSGTGGTVEAVASSGANLAINASSSAGIALLDSQGRGGDGGAGTGFFGGTGGDGGDGGAGIGGSVNLIANGGTITLNATALLVTGNGLSGNGGMGADGSGGPGAPGATSAVTGGNVLFEASNNPAGAGQIDLAVTGIDASGDAAGRVVFRGDGTITMTELDVTVAGAAAPTNNDVDTSTSGIFFAPVAGGAIRTTGDMGLTTDGSVGIYAQSGSAVTAGGALTIQAGDQVDIRHDVRAGEASTIRATGDLSITAGTSISGAPGSLLGAGGTLSLTANGPTATIGVDRLDGVNIVLNSSGAASVEHAEATNDFSATAASFRTGLNSIITGGDISINSPGAVDLGNSTAGGFVQVTGQSIAFNNIIAGTTVGLNAGGTAVGAEGIDGGSIDAGGDINLAANSITLTGPVTGNASFFAFANGGAVSVNNADVDGSISIFSAADLGGTYIAGGNVFLNSSGNITASAQANGGYVDGNDVVADGNLFAVATGDVTLTDSSAARMFGISAGQAASLAGGSAGEDLLMLGTTATLSDFTAGDDIRVVGSGGISVQNVATTGAGGDTANLSSFTSASVSFVINTAAANGANIVLTSDDGAITGSGAINANGDLTATAATGITQGSFVAGGDLDMSAGAAIVIVGATGGTVALDGATGLAASSVTSQGLTSLTADGGAIAIGNLSSVGAVSASGNSILVSNGGPLLFATLSTDVGNATVNTAGALTVTTGTVAGAANLRSTGAGLTINNLTAAGTVDASALTTLSVTGLVSAANIALASADITLGSAAQVGTGGVTQALSITNNNSDNQTFVGGTGTRNGYHIDAAELTRLYGTQISIVGSDVQDAGGGSVGSAAPPDIIVDSFTMTGGGAGSNLGANGSLTIGTPGKMRVIGDVLLTGLTDANTLNLVADDALEVILGQGSVRLINGTNAAGQLNLSSDDVIVATQAAIAAVGDATTTNAINDRLGENDGIILDEGALFARGIRANVAGGFYVQNSGAGTGFGERRGLTFGAGGLAVQTQGPSRIVINGVQIGANGQVTGLDVIPLLTIAPQANGVPGTFDPRSTLNGCLITSPAACTTFGLDFESNFPVQDIIEEETESDDSGEGSSLPVPLITMRDIDALTGEPLLDDPVTGAGNDDLWTAPTE
jgi:hypothetical protein